MIRFEVLGMTQVQKQWIVHTQQRRPSTSEQSTRIMQAFWQTQYRGIDKHVSRETNAVIDTNAHHISSSAFAASVTGRERQIRFPDQQLLKLATSRSRAERLETHGSSRHLPRDIIWMCAATEALLPAAARKIGWRYALGKCIALSLNVR